MKIIFVLAMAACRLCLASDLTALAMVESSGNCFAIGDTGKARGLYQIHEGTWKDGIRLVQAIVVESKPWSFATNAPYSSIVAAAILKDQSARFLLATKRKPSHADVYAMWNLGYAGYRKRGFDLSKCPAITRRAAVKFERFANGKT